MPAASAMPATPSALPRPGHASPDTAALTGEVAPEQASASSPLTSLPDARESAPRQPAAERAALRAAYLERLRRRVLEHREYPYLARRAGLEGVVRLRVSLGPTGQIAALRAAEERAPEPLLEAATRAVREAAPFGPLPAALGSELTVDIPVAFELGQR